jgi:hypothetical protein
VHPNAIGHRMAATEFVKWLTNIPSSFHPISSAQ